MKYLDDTALCRKLKKGEVSSPKALNGQWAITHHCNLKCLHCSIAHPDRPELELKTIKRIIDELYQEGCLWLTFTGGEPFTRPDFLEIYSYAKSKGFLITLFTNGTLIDKEIVNYLERFPPVMLEITLHSIIEDTFDKITQVPGSLQQCLEAVRLIREKNLPLCLKIVGLTLNRKDILKTKEFIRNLNGVKFKFDQFVLPCHDRSKEPLKYRLSTQEVIAIEKEMEEIFTQKDDYCNQSGNGADNGTFRCAVGLTSFYIDAYGQLRLCSQMIEPTFNLSGNNFHETFYNFLAEARKSYSQIYAGCNSCKIRQFCNECPAVFLLENSKPNSGSKYFCEVANLRAIA